jgi:hypothetical protein
MSDVLSLSQPKSASGYFMLAHRDTAICHDTTRLIEYKAAIKHAILFNKTLVISDHMVVNSPNFRLAYNSDRNFQDIICSGFLEIAHFDKFINGPHFTLRQLRDFYHRIEDHQGYVFHPNLPHCFRTEEFDFELDRIQDSITHRFPPSELRDPLFTQLVTDQMESEFLKDALGNMYSSYEVAFERLKSDVMASDYPIFGIIHFDPEHSLKRESTIFGYLADTRRARAVGLSIEGLIKKYGPAVSHPHRALLVRAETQILGARAVLPSDLKDYRRLVLPASRANSIQKSESEEVQFDLGLVLTKTALAFLTLEQLRECRKMGEEYFSILQGLDDIKSADVVANALKKYVHSLNLYLDRLPINKVERSNRVRGFVKVLYGTVLDDDLRGCGLGILVSLSAMGITTLTHVVGGTIALAAGAVAAKRVSPYLKSLAENKVSKQDTVLDDIRARIVKLPNVGSLTQYEL